MNQRAQKQTKPQAKSFTPEAAKDALWQKRLTVAALARKIRRPRSTVSKAIHADRFPHVRLKIGKALGL